MHAFIYDTPSSMYYLQHEQLCYMQHKRKFLVKRLDKCLSLPPAGTLGLWIHIL
jgi:hypothetical protein